MLRGEDRTDYKITLSDCLKLTYGESSVSDMVDLEELNEPELLHNIKRRYGDDMIFTYCGPTLLIINPYKAIPNLFNAATMSEFQALVFTEVLEYKALAPHIFGLTAYCLWQLFSNERNQAIVISGESGAGKTENTKYALKFLSSLGKNVKELLDQNRIKLPPTVLRALERVSRRSKALGIEDRILGCNQILEVLIINN